MAMDRQLLKTTDLDAGNLASAELFMTTTLSRQPFIHAANQVQGRVFNYKEHARSFYFEVLLTAYECPTCTGRLIMTGISQCSCSNGHVWNPTITFQVSDCCQARLNKKTFHYACSSCGRSVQSRFLFDGKVFDKDYFREMMQESRTRAAGKRERIKNLLADSRSDTLSLTEYPDLEAIPGLLQDLDDLFQTTMDPGNVTIFEPKTDFHMDLYRRHILSVLGRQTLRFSDISALSGDNRLDRVRRFITLVFMDNDLEVEIEQQGDDLLIQRR